MTVLSAPPSLTSHSSSALLSTPLCASRYFEWKSRPSKLCQGIRAAVGSGLPLAQLAPSRWLSPRTYRDPSCTARLHREGSCEQREGKKINYCGHTCGFNAPQYIYIISILIYIYTNAPIHLVERRAVKFYESKFYCRRNICI